MAQLPVKLTIDKAENGYILSWADGSTQGAHSHMSRMVFQFDEDSGTKDRLNTMADLLYSVAEFLQDEEPAENEEYRLSISIMKNKKQ